MKIIPSKKHETQMRVVPSRRTDPRTSHQGEKDAKFRATAQKQKLMEVYYREDRPMSSEEASELAGINLSVSSFWTRCSELHLQNGYLRDTGEVWRSPRTKSERIVYEITERGKAYVRGTHR